MLCACRATEAAPSATIRRSGSVGECCEAPKVEVQTAAAAAAAALLAATDAAVAVAAAVAWVGAVEEAEAQEPLWSC